MRTKAAIFTLTGHTNTVATVKCQAVDPQVIINIAKQFDLTDKFCFECNRCHEFYIAYYRFSLVVMIVPLDYGIWLQVEH